MTGGLFLALLLAAQPAPTDELLNLYRMANAYQTSATRRSCADASLGPRLAATRQRMDQARSRMTDRYGAERLRASEVAIVTAGDVCADPGGAATSLANFDFAVARLEDGAGAGAGRVSRANEPSRRQPAASG